MVCGKIKALLGRYIDGDLGADEVKFVEEHLGACADCRAEYEMLFEMVSVSGEIGLCPGADFAASVMERIRAGDFAADGKLPKNVVNMPEGDASASIRRWMRKIAMPATVVASVLVMVIAAYMGGYIGNRESITRVESGGYHESGTDNAGYGFTSADTVQLYGSNEVKSRYSVPQLGAESAQLLHAEEAEEDVAEFIESRPALGSLAGKYNSLWFAFADESLEIKQFSLVYGVLEPKVHLRVVSGSKKEVKAFVDEAGFGRQIRSERLETFVDASQKEAALVIVYILE